MSPKAQRIAIAEACGWKHRLATHDAPVERCGMKLPNSFGNQIEAWWHETNEQHRGVYAIPPDFLADLNAMHGAEKALPLGSSVEYWHYLFDVHRRYQGSISAPTVIYMVSATAAQRAEAFLRTLGKWEEWK